MSGQLIIAISIGLHFTSNVLGEIANHFWLILAVSFLMLLLSLLGISVMRLLYKDMPTVFFALMPANFAEMIQLGIRYNADTTQIAAAHSIRLVLIVLSVPALFFVASDFQPSTAEVVRSNDWSFIVPLLAGGAIAAVAWKHCGLPNPWMFGPMALIGLITVMFDLELAMPRELSQYGQLMIGCSLGSFIDRNFFRNAPGFLLGVAAFILCMMICTFACAWAVGTFADFPISTLALGMMPGSSTEMYLTAETLHLGVGLVTAMQITRLITVMMFAEAIYKYWASKLLVTTDK